MAYFENLPDRTAYGRKPSPGLRPSVVKVDLWPTKTACKAQPARPERPARPARPEL